MGKSESEATLGTRDAILAAARKVLLDEGLAAVTTRHVASVAGVSQALVHYHFGPIENLLLDVLDSVAADTRRSERIFYGPGDLRVKWRKYMDFLISQDVPDGVTKIWAETVVMVASKAETRKRYTETIATSSHDRLYEVVRSGLPAETPEAEIEGLTALILAVRKAISLDALVGWERGRRELLRLVDSVIEERLDNESSVSPVDEWPTNRRPRKSTSPS